MNSIRFAGSKLIVIMLLALFFAPLAGKSQKLDALLDLNRFRISDSTTMLDIGLLVNGESVKFVPAGKGKFQARVLVTMMLSDSTGIKAADKLVMLSPILSDTAQEKPNFQMAKRFLLKNGNYTLSLTSNDANSKDPESKADVPVSLGFEKKNKVEISDIMLLSSFKKTDKPENPDSFIRNGYEMIPAMSNFYPAYVSELSFYSELYRTAAVLGGDASFLVVYGVYGEHGRSPLKEFSRQSKQKAQNVNVVMATLDISKLPSGNYRFGIEVRDKNNKLVASHFKPIQRSNQEAAILAASEQNLLPEQPLTFARDIDSTKLGLYLMSLHPIANTNEVSFISGLLKSGNINDQRKYLEHFWGKRSSTNTQGLWLDYQQRIEYVEKTFGMKNYRGYQTDRGRVYLQYGPPNKIDNERTDVRRGANSTDIIPYQLWHYYHIGNQNNKIFVFVQSNLGNDNFRLTHSDMPGEVNFPEWRQQVVQQKFPGDKATPLR
ncbi:MAG: GWxTD domain-containing protein [Chitinophagaceae bacterium]|nr:MAG: GWxTD domain-containing protein [Chitinophagaceae bacterium]